MARRQLAHQRQSCFKGARVNCGDIKCYAPGDAGPLWEALKASQLIETALGTGKESEADKRYLEALAEKYNNASAWGTRRQILSV